MLYGRLKVYSGPFGDIVDILTFSKAQGRAAGFAQIVARQPGQWLCMAGVHRCMSKHRTSLPPNFFVDFYVSDHLRLSPCPVKPISLN